MAKSLSQLLEALPKSSLAKLPYCDGSVVITAPVVESAQDVEPGGVFVARKGLSLDGHDYIPQALERGAVAIVGAQAIVDLPVPYIQVRDPQQILGYLAAAYHGFPSRSLTIIGVTGTNGKTTTSTLIHSILKAHSKNAGYISTLAADLGGQTSDTGLHVTTPSASQIQAYLAEMVANGVQQCVLEMTSHGLAQGRLQGVDIDVAVLTNITHEHLDFHGSFENYRAAKARMFEMLMESYHKPGQPKISVINADDPSIAYFSKIRADHLLTFGIMQEADFRAVDIKYGSKHTRFSVQAHEYMTSLMGEFNVSNVLAAIAVANSLNRPPDVIQAGLNAVKVISGRMERIDEGQNFQAMVDFAHTPDALEKALKTARMLVDEGGRLIVVFGSAGLRDVEKRRLMSEISIQLADHTVLTAEDPRTESLDTILRMMADACTMQGGVEEETFQRVPDRGRAIYKACQMARTGDVVIACGKGHEQSMCFGTVEHPWDDRDAMRSALRGEPLLTLPTASP